MRCSGSICLRQNSGQNICQSWMKLLIGTELCSHGADFGGDDRLKPERFVQRRNFFQTYKTIGFNCLRN